MEKNQDYCETCTNKGILCRSCISGVDIFGNENIPSYYSTDRNNVCYGNFYISKTPKQRTMDKIEKVIFNDPATIVFWKDGTKTIVKADGERFDPEKGLAMAISKYFFNNRGHYYDVFKKWLPKEGEK